MEIGEKIDINKGKLPYKGRGLENSVNIAACCFGSDFVLSCKDADFQTVTSMIKHIYQQFYTL